MANEPVIDGRDREDILDRMKTIAPYYTDEWDPHSEDAGTVMFELFADLTEGVVERLDRVPEKHRMAFLDSLGFNTFPPQPSRVPLSFQLSESATDNVRIPPSTTATAPATETRPEQRFETLSDRSFEATPASLTHVYGVDPGTDRLTDHGERLLAAERTQLFTGENIQDHELYFGHDDLLTLTAGSTIELEIETDAPERLVANRPRWEFYGVDTDTDTEGWHRLGADSEAAVPTTSFSEREQTTKLTQRLEAFFKRYGLTKIADHDEYELLIRSITDDIRKGRFGEDSAGQLLPANLVDSAVVDADLAAKLRSQLSTLQDRFQASATGGFQPTADPVRLAFTIPGEITETEVDGIESRWLRCRVPDDELSNALFNLSIESVTLSIEGETVGESVVLEPDEGFSNDTPLTFDDDGPIRPFGRRPTTAAIFSLACEEAFTKPGSAVELRFEAVDEAAGEADDETETDGTDGDESTDAAAAAAEAAADDEPADQLDDGSGPDQSDENTPEIAWEFWDGNGWRQLRVDDGTRTLRESGSVSFTIPESMVDTEQFGHENRWIRARLVSGDYGQPKVVETGEHNWETVTDHISPPTFESVSVAYTQPARPVNSIVTTNNRSTRQIEPDDGEFHPFVPLPGEQQALYLGFDRALRNGPIQLYLPLEGVVYPDSFNPWLNVEYCSDPDRGRWTRLEITDGTADFAERGILSCTFPEPTVGFELFGVERHWLRIRVTGDEFVRTTGAVFVPEDGTESHAADGTAFYDADVSIRDDRTRTAPVLYGVHPNTQWAENVELIEDEGLGSSSGTGRQRFSFSSRPVMDPEIWVDEHESLSETQRRRLLQTSPDSVDRITRDGTVRAFWVQWEVVEDFFTSGTSERHCVVDQTGGVVRFGNGKHGMVPPAGENNVRASYRIGGGSDGDVEAGAITGLSEAIAFVDEVSNPEASEGGEDTEPVEQLVSRAPKQIRDRGRPVTTDGFERIALSASRELARVRCKPGMDANGRSQTGCVTLLIVPNVDQPKPVPPVALTNRVEAAVRADAPLSLVGNSESNLTVRGPTYLETSVDVRLQTTGKENLTDIKEQIEHELQAFIHPLTGGPSGDGWEIGRVPPPVVFSSHLEQLPAVARIEEIAVTYETAGDELTLAGNDTEPRVPPDVLIYSGRHSIAVSTGGDR